MTLTGSRLPGSESEYHTRLGWKEITTIQVIVIIIIIIIISSAKIDSIPSIQPVFLQFHQPPPNLPPQHHATHESNPDGMAVK